MFEWNDDVETPDENDIYLTLVRRDWTDYMKVVEYVDDGEGICDDGWQLEKGEELLGWADLPECSSPEEYQNLIKFVNWYREYCISNGFDGYVENIESISILYSTFDDEEREDYDIPVQVYVDLVNHTEIIECGAFTITTPYNSYKDLIEDYDNATWDDIYNYAVGKLREERR